MKIIRKINTSAALAVDSQGREVVVLGKGVGFPAVPYDLDDLSKIERTFYDVDPQYHDVIAGVPEDILQASAEIFERAEEVLGTDINPNLPFTLADHLNFAVERLRSGIDLTNPLSYDVRYLYPDEYSVAKEGLDTLTRRTGIILPESEAINISLHLINAEKNGSDTTKVLRDSRIMEEVDRIIEGAMGIVIDRESYEYSRYVKHMLYLIRRFESGKEDEVKNGQMLNTLAKEYPEIYTCAYEVTRYFQNTWGWNCNKDETLYLMLHINRLLS